MPKRKIPIAQQKKATLAAIASPKFKNLPPKTREGLKRYAKKRGWV